MYHWKPRAMYKRIWRFRGLTIQMWISLQSMSSNVKGNFQVFCVLHNHCREAVPHMGENFKDFIGQQELLCVLYNTIEGFKTQLHMCICISHGFRHQLKNKVNLLACWEIAFFILSHLHKTISSSSELQWSVDKCFGRKLFNVQI